MRENVRWSNGGIVEWWNDRNVEKVEWGQWRNCGDWMVDYGNIVVIRELSSWRHTSVRVKLRIASRIQDCGSDIVNLLSHCPEIDPRWTHENEATHDVREFVSMPMISQSPPKLMPNTTGVHLMVYDASPNGLMFLRYFYDHFWNTGQCEACLIVYLPGMNFGTVWDLYFSMHSNHGQDIIIILSN